MRLPRYSTAFTFGTKAWATHARVRIIGHNERILRKLYEIERIQEEIKDINDDLEAMHFDPVPDIKLLLTDLERQRFVARDALVDKARAIFGIESRG